MPAQNKINQYGYGQKVLELEQTGLTHEEIARELTKMLDGKDTISQPTVSRWVQKEKKESSQLINNIRREYREKEFAKDMEIINERIQDNYSIVTDKLVMTDNNGKKTISSNFTHKERREAEREMREWLKLKAHYCGLDSESSGIDAGSPVDLDSYRLDNEKEACNA